jgi:hypothetical protein
MLVHSVIIGILEELIGTFCNMYTLYVIRYTLYSNILREFHIYSFGFDIFDILIYL